MNNNIKNNLSQQEQADQVKKNANDAFALSTSAKEKIPSLFEPERFKKALELFSLFHRYSYINIILIFLQQPNATYVAGFKTWQTSCMSIWNDTSRQVLKQEHKGKGIRLLAPYTYAPTFKDRQLMNSIVSVYDISQTNALPPLEQDPEYVLQPKVKNVLSAARFHSPYRITTAGRENHILQNGLAGYCDHEGRLIVLDESLSGTRLLSETLREVIRAEIKLVNETQDDYIDLITESVLFVLNHHFGRCLNSETNELLFIKRYQERPLEELASVLHLIQKLSHKLIDLFDSFLGEINEYDASSWPDAEAFRDFEFETV